MVTISKKLRIIKYKRLTESIINRPNGNFYLCVDLGVTNDNPVHIPELELFEPDVVTEKMGEDGWFGRGSDNPESNANRLFVLAMMIEMAK